MTRKPMTPDELMYKCNLYDDNGMAYITALDAYKNLYTQHQALVEALKRISARSNVCENDNEGQCFCCAANGEIVNAALAQGE